ncbi:ABC transporter ATP-binding protein [Paenibacillus turpanensis]|uniref:ABC transporter ATP-binding protein n=1 Tax=Paenibacillus turpanensis TaxID=2689078 RepID=UPI00140CF7A5|nr:oligopeptide/dipeptide ABC transporter ATP-binding protein [Paenibacillus turpanensis]
MSAPLLQVEGIKKVFSVGGSLHKTLIHAVNGISFTVAPGETLGIVGESGCGKSTVGRLILRLMELTEGEIYFDGRSLSGMKSRELNSFRRHLQCVFQDPYASLNPRMPVGRAIAEPMVVHDKIRWKEALERAGELLVTVGLSRESAALYPHEFSGGQRQRIAIARALALKPKLIVADEAVSALDVSIQAQIVNLLTELQAKTNVSYLFISHNLSIVRHISDRVAVMYLGKIVELADKNPLYDSPRHPYTQALLSSVPEPDAEHSRERIILQGEVPNAARPPSGCAFHPRCPFVRDKCRAEEPRLREVGARHYASCHFIEEAQYTN